jgi:hypothetical protein
MWVDNRTRSVLRLCQRKDGDDEQERYHPRTSCATSEASCGGRAESDNAADVREHGWRAKRLLCKNAEDMFRKLGL